MSWNHTLSAQCPPANRLLRGGDRKIGKQIWEQNSAELAGISATARTERGTRPRLSCTFEIWRPPENPWCVAHNPEVADPYLVLVTSANASGGLRPWRLSCRS